MDLTAYAASANLQKKLREDSAKGVLSLQAVVKVRQMKPGKPFSAHGRMVARAIALAKIVGLTEDGQIEAIEALLESGMAGKRISLA